MRQSKQGGLHNREAHPEVDKHPTKFTSHGIVHKIKACTFVCKVNQKKTMNSVYHTFRYPGTPPFFISANLERALDQILLRLRACRHCKSRKINYHLDIQSQSIKLQISIYGASIWTSEAQSADVCEAASMPTARLIVN